MEKGREAGRERGEKGDMLCRAPLWCSGRGCLSGPMMRHPSPLRYQPSNRSSIEQSLFGAREGGVKK